MAREERGCLQYCSSHFKENTEKQEQFTARVVVREQGVVLMTVKRDEKHGKEEIKGLAKETLQLLCSPLCNTTIQTLFMKLKGCIEGRPQKRKHFLSSLL